MIKGVVYLQQRAAANGVDVHRRVNDMFKPDIALVEALAINNLPGWLVGRYCARSPFEVLNEG